LCESGTTIIGRKGTINSPIYVNQKFWNVDTAFGISPLNNIDSKYIHYLCVGFDFKKLDKSTTIPSLAKRDIVKIKFPLAPLPEQRAIASKIEQLFSELDNGIANLKTAKSKLEIYRQAILKQAFEGELTKEWRKKQPKNHGNHVNQKNHSADNLPETWQWVKLGDMALKITDGEHITPKRTEKGYLLLSARNIQNGFLSLKNVDYIPEEEYKRITKRCNPQVGDILISCSGSIGRVCRVPPKLEFSMVRSVALVKLDWENNSSKFFEYLFLSPLLQSQIHKSKKATAQANLFLAPIKNLLVISCSLKEQTQIVQEIETRLSVCDKLNEAIEQSLEKAQALRQSILKKAFEGKLLSEDELQNCRQQPDWEPAAKLLEKVKKDSKTKKS
jgi:type I restriction enzyme S subunit